MHTTIINTTENAILIRSYTRVCKLKEAPGGWKRSQPVVKRYDS